jgi:hypothetical protein
VSGGLALAGCASIDELKDAISRWLATGSFGEPEAPPEDLPQAFPLTPPQNPKEMVNWVSERRDRRARNLRTAEVPKKPSHLVPIKAAEPQGATPMFSGCPSNVAAGRLQFHLFADDLHRAGREFVSAERGEAHLFEH